MFRTRGNREVGVDALSETRKNWTYCDREDEPCTPIPASPVPVDTIGVVHVADIEFLVTNEVEIGERGYRNRNHETCVTGEESEELSTLATMINHAVQVRSCMQARTYD